MIKVKHLTVVDENGPLPGVTATFVFCNAEGDELPLVFRKADADGYISCPYEADLILIEVIVDAGPGFWSMHYASEDLPRRVQCPRLPEDGPIGWWHRTLGVDRHDPESGAGIRIGVIDTGMAAHRDLAHVRCIGTIFGGRHTGDIGDLAGHGTHVAGLIASRPVEGGYAGIAPGATVLVARVCDQISEFRSQDVTRAIGILVDEGADIINLSLGSAKASETITQAIRDAFAKGVLCVAAAGNTPERPQFPAHLEQVVGVGAFGKMGWGPPHSHASSFQPRKTDPALWDDLFRPHFTARGDGLDMVAPGVALISTVPDGAAVSTGYLTMTGTSMAAPLVSGLLAVLLAKDANYPHMSRDGKRAERAKEILKGTLRCLGLPDEMQGGGIPGLYALGSP